MASKNPRIFCSIDPDFLKQYRDQTKAIKPSAAHTNINKAATPIAGTIDPVLGAVVLGAVVVGAVVVVLGAVVLGAVFL